MMTISYSSKVQKNSPYIPLCHFYIKSKWPKTNGTRVDNVYEYSLDEVDIERYLSTDFGRMKTEKA